MNNAFKVGSGGRGKGEGGRGRGSGGGRERGSGGKEKWGEGEGEVGERGKVDAKNIFLEEFSFGLKERKYQEQNTYQPLGLSCFQMV